MAGEAFTVQVQWDQAGLTSFDRYMETHEGKALAKRIDKAMAKALRPLAGKLKTAESASGIVNRSGKLRRSIGCRKARKRPGEVIAYTVGPSDRKARMVIPGHENVGHRPGKRDLGSHTRAFPFVDPVIEREAHALQSQLSSDVWASSIRPL